MTFKAQQCRGTEAMRAGAVGDRRRIAKGWFIRADRRATTQLRDDQQVFHGMIFCLDFMAERPMRSTS